MRNSAFRGSLIVISIAAIVSLRVVPAMVMWWRIQRGAEFRKSLGIPPSYASDNYLKDRRPAASLR